MVNLSTAHMRYLTPDDFRVLGAVDAGSRSHELVPTKLIHSLSGLRSVGQVERCISTLARAKLVGRLANRPGVEGYRLTGAGADHLAMRALAKKGALKAVGNQIGVGKEADVYACTDDMGNDLVVKFHRLGRTSFRNAARSKRDYRPAARGKGRGRRRGHEIYGDEDGDAPGARSGNGNGHSGGDNSGISSWTYLSRLSAEREHAFMAALYARGFPIPRPMERQRHCVVMQLVDAYPLHQIERVLDATKLVDELLAFAVLLARHGLVHGDLNEFNVLVHESGRPCVIDFPQMISIDHHEAQQQFDRDVSALYAFFARKFNHDHGNVRQRPTLPWALTDAGGSFAAEASADWDVRRPDIADGQAEAEAEAVPVGKREPERIDRLVMASGAFTKRQIDELERAMRASKLEDDRAGASDDEEGDAGSDDGNENDETDDDGEVSEEEQEFIRDVRS